ncbi:MAG: pilin [Candidatus Saccharimonadales bacterium]
MKAVLKKVAQATLLVPALVLGLAVVVPGVAYAQECTEVDVREGIGQGARCAKPTNAAENLFGPESIFTTVTNILLFIIGAIAVIMLIVGGIRYVVSGGDQAAVTSAKNTILYAIIGIVVAFLAFAAVQFVTSQLNQGTGTSVTSSRTV